MNIMKDTTNEMVKTDPFAPVLDRIMNDLLTIVEETQKKMQITTAPSEEEAAYARHYFLHHLAMKAKQDLPAVDRNFLEKGIYGIGYTVGYPLQMIKSVLGLLPGAQHFADGLENGEDKAKAHMLAVKQKAILMKIAIENKIRNSGKDMTTVAEPVAAAAA